MNIKWCTRSELQITAAKQIIPTQVILDIGAGIEPQKFFKPAVHVIIDPYLPYINVLKEKKKADHMIFLHGTWDKTLPLFPDKSVDTIFALDVIEHFEKEDGLRFLKEAERVARKQIVIFTPWGLYEQDYDEDNLTDRWGMQGGFWQAHRSGWTPEDFDGEWQFFASKEFHKVDQHELVLDHPHGAFWAIKTFGSTHINLSQNLKYFLPKIIAKTKSIVKKLIGKD
jgi:hypothetical protein